MSRLSNAKSTGWPPNERVGEQTIGADDQIRTDDLPLTRRLLYQLSYVGKLVCEIERKAREFGSA